MSGTTHCANCGGEVPFDKPHRVGECPASPLVEFLLARYDEAEDLAAECSQKGLLGFMAVNIDRATRASDGRETALSGWDERFLAAQNPRRALADIEAKRRIVERCAPLADMQVRRQTRTLAHDTLCALALPFADHPDYDERWTP